MVPVCPVTKRLQSLILVKDALGIIKNYHESCACARNPSDLNNGNTKAPTDQWVQCCRHSLDALISHLHDLELDKEILGQSVNPHEHDIWAQLQYGAVVCLAAVVELCYLLGRSSPPLLSLESSTFRGRSWQYMEELIHATRALNQEDLNYLDPFIGVSIFHASSATFCGDTN